MEKKLTELYFIILNYLSLIYFYDPDRLEALGAFLGTMGTEIWVMPINSETYEYFDNTEVQKKTKNEYSVLEIISLARKFMNDMNQKEKGYYNGIISEIEKINTKLATTIAKIAINKGKGEFKSYNSKGN